MPLPDHEDVSRHKERRWKLWSGCCMPYVLWQPDGHPSAIETAPVSSELKVELLLWHVNVDEHLGPDGWDSPEAGELHVRRGRGLQKRLQRELDQPVDLDLSAGRVGW